MICYLITSISLVIIICLLDLRYGLLRDESTNSVKKPYSFARVQMAWWTVIVLSAITVILIQTEQIPPLSFDSSVIKLMGISAATMAVARVVDQSDQSKPVPIRHQNYASSGFFIDILSDENGTSMHRFQTIAFNILFGIWFVTTVLTNMEAWNILNEIGVRANIENIMPTISDGSLALLGLSAATYVAVKTTENRS